MFFSQSQAFLRKTLKFKQWTSQNVCDIIVIFDKVGKGIKQ